MAALGFRRPQFSEDLAWLPVWLQHQGANPSLQCAKDSQTPSQQVFKDSPLVRNIAEKTETYLCSKEGRFSNCHLFLSGEDNSPISFAQPSANVLQFHLHLSSDPDSQCDHSQIFHVSKPQSNSSEDISVERVENSSASEEIYKSKINSQVGRVKTLGTVENDVIPQSTPNERGKRRKYEGKSDVRGLKSADVNDAVEFSIAASEALVIHEIVKEESTLESLPAAAVLEVSLQVKQARLDRLEVFHSPIDEVDESDLLSEMDDLTMFDAFEDVGLSFSSQDDHHTRGSDGSKVKETPLSRNGDTCDNQGEHEEFLDHDIGFDNFSGKKQSGDAHVMDMQTVKDTPLESLQCEGRKEFSENLALGSNSSSVAGFVNPMPHHLVHGKSETNPMPQRENLSMIEASPVQLLSDINSSLAWNLENPNVDKVSSLTPDRYKSRWLGGWSTKEVDTVAPLQQNGTKRVPNFFLLQSSFLSESAEVAPDENSCVQKHQTRSNAVSQPSIQFEGLCDQDNEEILISQDGVRFCSPFADPLCSVVPCSVSSENAESLVAKNQNNTELTSKCCSPSSRIGLKELRKVSDLKGDCPYVDRQDASANGGDCSEARIERRRTSLKTYSRLLPNLNTHNSLSPSQCDQSLLCLDRNVGSTRYSHERSYKGLEPFRPVSDDRVVSDNEENHATTSAAYPVAEATSLKRNNECEKDEAEEQNQLLKEREPPAILNHRKRLRLKACKNSVENFTTEENPEHAVVPESSVELQNGKSLLRIPSEQSNRCAAQVPRRKRVRFLEAEDNIKKKGPQKLPSSHKSGSSSRAGKRLKCSRPELESRTRDLRRHLTTDWGKVGKTLIFQGVQFLLTGFSRKKQKEIEGLIHEYGGIVLSDIPSPNSRRKRNSRSKFLQLPVVICSKKLQTTKFLYGCAVDTFMLKLNWLTDSIAASSVEPPEKYMILPSHADVRHSRIGKPIFHDYRKPIFEGVGIMLHGKPSFCSKLAQIIKHGDGTVFKTLHTLVQSLDTGKISVGAIVAENEGRASRHLKHCALERKIPMMPSSWIIKSLHSRKLLPLPEDKHSSPSSTVTVSEVLGSMSEEI